jgi:hypothetical protein
MDDTERVIYSGTISRTLSPTLRLVIAWNRVVEAVLPGFTGALSGRRNILRMLFLDPRTREQISNWDDQARFAVNEL